MKKLINKYRKWILPVAVLKVLIGSTLIYLGMVQSLIIIVDGEPITIRSVAIRTSGVLRHSGIHFSDADRVRPSENQLFWGQAVIRIDTAREVLIKTPEETFRFKTAERIPENILDESGIALYPHDQLLVNGENIAGRQHQLAFGEPVLIQFAPAVPIRIVVDNQEFTIYANQPTLGAALEAAQFDLSAKDWLSEGLNTPLTGPLEVTVRRAQPMMIRSANTQLTGLTAALTVGEALQDFGVTLQNLDYSKPPDDAPIPENRQIRVVRVQETLEITTDEYPFSSLSQEDPNLPLDEIRVIEPGQPGITAVRERVQYADGIQVWQFDEAAWQASEPQEGVVGYGSKIVVQTEMVEGEPLEYYRKMTVFATAFSPCNLGVENYCSYTTFSGLPLEKGVIGVTRRWYGAIAGHRVYVTGYGYGVIGDIGGGYPDGRPWIDLGYSDEEYPGGVRWVTMYFLTPVPDYVPLRLR